MTTKNATKGAAMAALPAIMNEGQVIALVNSAIENARKGEGELHVAAYQALAYASKTNNTNPLARLANELPNSSRADALMAWVKAHAPLTFQQAKDKDGNKLFTQDQRKAVVVKMVKGRTEKDWKLADAYATPFFQFRKPPVEKEVEIDVSTYLNKLVGRIEKLLAKGGDSEHMTNLKHQLKIAQVAVKAVTIKYEPAH